MLLALLLCPVVVSPQSLELGNALLAAAGDGDSERVVAALSQGADVNYRNVDGWTALLFASIRGARDVVAILIAADADVDAQNVDGATPLMAAAVMGEREIAEMLAKAGADLSLRNVAGATARIKAQEYGHLEVADLLGTYEAEALAPVRASESERARLQSAPEPASRAEAPPTEPPAVVVTRGEPEPPPVAMTPTPQSERAPIAATRAPEPAPSPALEATLPTRAAAVTPRKPLLEDSAEFEIEHMSADYVITKGATLRAGPDTETKRLGSLARGTTVRVTGRVLGGNWYRIANGGSTAYVFGTVLAPQQEAPVAELPPVATAPPAEQPAPEPATAPAPPVAPTPSVEPVATSAQASGLALLSGRWASSQNPVGCVSEYLEIRARPEFVSVFVHSGADVFPLAEDLPVTHSAGSEIEAGTPGATWKFEVSRGQLLYSRAGRDPAHYRRCN